MEKIFHQNQLPIWEYPISIKQALSFSTLPFAFNFFLNNHFLPTIFLPTGNWTRSQASFVCKEFISSTMAFFQSSLSFESIASLTVLESSSIIHHENWVGNTFLVSFFPKIFSSNVRVWGYPYYGTSYYVETLHTLTQALFSLVQFPLVWLRVWEHL